VRVLVVDDSSAVRERMASMVRDVIGVLAVDEASDGDEALAVTALRLPDLVVLDLHMPNADGFSALTRLKVLVPTPIVMVLTNNPSTFHRKRCTRLGADLFFDKSTQFGRALEVIADLARQRLEGTSPLV
jgi:two-component system chemotaxis response regulator CheB